jgi:hypothetical protein
MIELGDEVKHTVTGYKGICIAITVWLHGCRRINVQAKLKDDGSMPEMVAFDEMEMVVTKKGVVAATPYKAPEVEQPTPRKKAGGPRPLGGRFRC